MKNLSSIIKGAMFVFVAAVSAPSLHAEKLAGGDISLLPLCENARAQYKTSSGAAISDLITWSGEQGMNSMRVRLFVNPAKYKAQHLTGPTAELKYDPNACQDLEYIIPICKRIKNAGMKLMLDIHYSDTWADPAKQWTPYDWITLTDAQLTAKVEEYTREVLVRLKQEGATPDLVQVGNEISYGMLWGTAGTSSPKKCYATSEANWTRFGDLLKAGIRAVREVCPQAKVVLHTERVTQTSTLTNFYARMGSMGVKYDVIGLSYYPYFHGGISVLKNALSAVTGEFTDKEVMIVETGYSCKWAVPGTTYDLSGTWPYSDAGQKKFMTDLLATVNQYPRVTGVYWWWMEYNAYPYSTTKLDGWYNAPLFDSETGKATSALSVLAAWGETSGVEDIAADGDRNADDNYYDLSGRAYKKPVAPGVYIHRGRKIMIK